MFFTHGKPVQGWGSTVAHQVLPEGFGVKSGFPRPAEEATQKGMAG